MRSKRLRTAGVIVPLVIALAACGNTTESVPSASGPSTTAADTPTTTVAPTEPPTTTEPPASSAPAVETTEATEPTMSTPPSTSPSTPPSGSPTDIASADLAARLGIDVDQIEVVSVEEVTWPDGALGCPEPDRMYTQALVNGSRILLRAAGVVHEYHSGRGDAPFFCPPARIQSPTSAGNPDS